MKRANSCIVLGALLTASWGVQKQDESNAQVQALEKRVEVLEKYAQTQAKAAEALVRSLDESDVQGFTYGINPTSRKVLLAGLRSLAASAQQGVPGASSETKEEPAKPIKQEAEKKVEDEADGNE